MAEIVELLRSALGDGVVLDGADIPIRNQADWSGAAPTSPLALVLPHTVEQISTALRLCHAAGQTIVVQGGMTGLASGATPEPDEIALSLERLTGVEEVDTMGATLTAYAGTTLEEIQTAAEAQGFSVGVDLGARGSCSIGGNVATNAGGVQVLRYGMTRANVRGLEVVLSDGTVVTGLNKMLKNNAGFDWAQLFVGSEGALGVITRVVVALHPPRRNICTAFCTSTSFTHALKTLRNLEMRLSGSLLAFEAMWPDFVDFACNTCAIKAPYDPGKDIALIIEATAAGENGAALFETALMDLIEDGTLTNAVIAKSDQERRRIWALREAPAEFPTRLPGLIAFDVSVPLADFAAAAMELKRTLEAGWPGITSLFYGHVADSNLHLIVHMPMSDEQPTLPVNKLVYDTVAQFGGSVSAEHGIGKLKKPYLSKSRTPEELALMRRLKDAFDPSNILNRGRII